MDKSGADPLFSIITVSYNAKESIEDTINSIVNQTYSNFEYIIVDGGSTDGTLDIIRKYEDKISYWISEPDNGIYDAMNKGLAICKGELINFMNSVDLFYNDHVLVDIYRYCDFKKFHILYGKTVVKETGRVIVPPLKIRKKYFLLDTICHQSIFFNRSIFMDLGTYSLDYKIIADRDLLLKSIINEKRFLYVDVVVSLWESLGFSGNNLKLFKNEEKLLVNRNFNTVEIYFIRINYKFRQFLNKLKL